MPRLSFCCCLFEMMVIFTFWKTTWYAIVDGFFVFNGIEYNLVPFLYSFCSFVIGESFLFGGFYCEISRLSRKLGIWLLS